MSRSEIFEEYARIVREQGLVSEAADKSPRRGSDDISTIEALYGIKPNGKDEKTLTEQAHPEPVIIAPAYDRINGLVENNQERQNIMVGICNKPHQAKLTQHRYAQTRADLTNELVRLGFYLDNQKEEMLTTLADACAEKLTKLALIPALLIGGAAIVGLLGVYNNFGEISQGIRADCQRIEEQLQSMISSSDYDNNDEALAFMLSNVQFIRELADEIEIARGDMPSVSLEGAAQIKDTPQHARMEKLLHSFVRNCRILSSEIPRYVDILTGLDDNPNAESEANWWAAAKAAYRQFSPAAAEALISTFETLTGALAKAPQVVGAIRKQYEANATLQQRKLIADQQDEEDPSELQSKMPENQSKDDSKKPSALDQLTDLKKEIEST